MGQPDTHSSLQLYVEVCMCVRMYVCTFVYTYTHTHVYTHTCMYTHTDVCVYTYTPTHTADTNTYLYSTYCTQTVACSASEVRVERRRNAAPHIVYTKYDYVPLECD
jgi:hypothetical protein